jgi:hypothetical protein
MTSEHRKAISLGNIGKHSMHRSEEWKNNISKSMKGKSAWNKGLRGFNCGNKNGWYGRGREHPLYKDGLGHQNYSLEFNRNREIARNRDGYKCASCGIPQEEFIRRLNVHHIDENKHNNNLNNLTTLCYKCHSLIHKGRK